MKKIILTMLAVLIITSLRAQITIDNGDMPSVNDTIRISIALPSPFIDVSATGPNQSWDYSTLSPVTQRIDTFRSIVSTDPIYALFFSFGANTANLATYAGDQPSAGGITITEAFNFYNKSSAQFKQVGVAGKLNGFPTPVAFSPHDIIYKFPLNYNNQDSSNSGMTFDLPNTFYYAYTQKRVNHADGWGSLTIPYGTFQTIRVKSEITGRDSMYIDSLSQGFAFNRPLLTEHKWLGKTQDVPLLQINTQTQFGVPLVTLVDYRDSARVLTSVVEQVVKPVAVKTYPNPFFESMTIDYTLTAPSSPLIEITDMQGRVVYVRQLPTQAPGEYQYILGGRGTLSKGTYILNLTTGADATVSRKVVFLE